MTHRTWILDFDETLADTWPSVERYRSEWDNGHNRPFFLEGWDITRGWEQSEADAMWAWFHNPRNFHKIALKPHVDEFFEGIVRRGEFAIILTDRPITCQAGIEAALRNVGADMWHIDIAPIGEQNVAKAEWLCHYVDTIRDPRLPLNTQKQSFWILDDAPHHLIDYSRDGFDNVFAFEYPYNASVIEKEAITKITSWRMMDEIGETYIHGNTGSGVLRGTSVR